MDVQIIATTRRVLAMTRFLSLFSGFTCFLDFDIFSYL